MNHLAVSFAFSAILSKRSKSLEPAVPQAKAFVTLTRNGGMKGIRRYTPAVWRKGKYTGIVETMIRIEKASQGWRFSNTS